MSFKTQSRRGIFVARSARSPRARDIVSRVKRLDGTMLDVYLGGKTAFELADTLRERGVPVPLPSKACFRRLTVNSFKISLRGTATIARRR